eukprot:765481-Hanusia_phi.AAC.3
MKREERRGEERRGEERRGEERRGEGRATRALYTSLMLLYSFSSITCHEWSSPGSSMLTSTSGLSAQP